MKRRKVEFEKTILFLRIHLRLDFLCLISLVSSFAKEETRETRRKEKKEERLPRSRLPFDKIPLRQARWILSALMRDLRSFYVREFGRSKSFAPNSLVCGDGGWWSFVLNTPVGDDVLGVPQKRTISSDPVGEDIILPPKTGRRGADPYQF